MKTNHALTSGALLTGAAVAYALFLYPSLGDQIPTHWNWKGQVDGWMSKNIGAFFAPGIMALFLALLCALPWLSPRNFTVDSFRETYNYIMLVVIALMGYLHVTMLQAGLHPGLDVGRALIGGLFLFLALLGNVLGKVRRNFWVGVRTPWTLANDTVWIATHRLAARLFVLFGILGALAIWLGAPVSWCFVAFMVAVVVPAIHSLVLYKRVEIGASSSGR